MRVTNPPCVIALAGPNGAGKSTAGPALLKGALRVTEFVNADMIAQGLSVFEPETVALAAGKIMLARLRELARRRVSFAFETTLAGRTYAPWISDLIQKGYEFHLLFLWLPSAEFAVERVRGRVRLGGHPVPEETIRRRYRAGLRNFFSVYRPLAASWRVYDNSSGLVPRLIAAGRRTVVTRVKDKQTWKQIMKEAQK